MSTNAAEAGQDVVDPALVDVADYRPAAPALYIELSDAPVLRRLGGAPAATPLGWLDLGAIGSRRVAFGLQDRDSGFATVRRDEHLLSQQNTSWK
jgi:hypothetical protein